MLTKADHLSLLNFPLLLLCGQGRSMMRGARRPFRKLRFLDLNADPDQVDIECIIRYLSLDALRDQLHGIGKRLLQGQHRQMSKGCRTGSSLEGSRGTRIDIIDKCWDGIGRKGDMWVS